MVDIYIQFREHVTVLPTRAAYRQYGKYKESLLPNIHGLNLALEAHGVPAVLREVHYTDQACIDLAHRQKNCAKRSLEQILQVKRPSRIGKSQWEAMSLLLFP